MNHLRIGGATVNQTPLDWPGNKTHIIDAIEEAKAQQVKLLCFPELSVTGYGCEDLFLSDWLSEKAWQTLLEIVPHTQNIAVCLGLPLRMDGITYNGACVIHNQKILGIALKQNLARDGVHYEPRWFDAWPPNSVIELTRDGNTFPVGDLIFELEGIKFGFEICEDSWRKEKRPGYRLAQRGVNLILNLSASHFAMGKSQLREQEVVKDGSKKFNCAYLFVNLLGNEAGRMIYDGDIIFGLNGEVVQLNNRLSLKPFNVLWCDVDFTHPEKTKRHTLTDSKIKNEEFSKATSLALFDYLRKSKAKGYVLSLSGGADSSLCAILVAEMVRRGLHELGPEKFCEALNIPVSASPKEITGKLLTCAYQGTKNSSQATFTSSEQLAHSIGAQFYQWTIDDEVESYESKIENVLGRSLTWEQDDIARQNIQARSRSPIIWMLANIKQAILLTTSNRSEGDVGYATMDGDTSGSLAPIAGIDKPFILQWLKWAEKELGYTGLRYVNNLTPTAELRPSERAQTDEKDLMPYPILLEIERLAINNRLSPAEVYLRIKSQPLPGNPNAALLKTYVVKFFRLWAANQWKRERLAPSFHLDEWNVDPRSWCRFPILSGGFKVELEDLEKL
ncbi:MAG TPA: NAD(+) synthase [Cyclobacteriaceae bacterium]|jgi:NAD+ synthase (glutamine-hydrolysing)|nr:NAD(+) synthase [Cytophagales bacterium]HRE68327.1 NAD(+) synthase [Cyclobacteriaceae bacterium]HRF35518.1 NAD(+) synthase [Cyclobacteriaceae bacterium]